MKRLLVLVAFILVVLGALGGAAYMIFGSEASAPRKPVTAVSVDVPEDALGDDTSRPLDRSTAGPAPESASATPPNDSTTTPNDREPRADTEATRPDRTNPEVTKTPDPDSTEPAKPDSDRPERAVTPGKSHDAQVTLSGRVSDEGGSVVAGAAIMLNYLAPQGGTETRGRSAGLARSLSIAATDNEGAYTANIKLTFPGENQALTVTLFAQAGNGLKSAEMTVELNPGEERDGLDFVLPLGGELIGQVVNQRLEAMSGVTVTAQLEGGRKTDIFKCVSDSQGSFFFNGLAPGAYRISAAADGFQTASDALMVEVVSGQTVNMPEALQMKPLTAIRVRLVSADSQPRGPVTATFTTSSGKNVTVKAVADADGYALISSPPEDAVEAVFSANGYEPSNPVAVSVIADDHVDVGEVSLTPKLERD